MNLVPRTPRRRVRGLAAFLLLCSLLPSCVTLDYDLSQVAIPISAKPAPAGTSTRPLHIEVKNVLWVHGLFGHQQPDLVALLQEQTQGATAIANFRVRQAGSFHDWLLTHLTATLMRMKTVVIEGELVGEAR